MSVSVVCKARGARVDLIADHLNVGCVHGVCRVLQAGVGEVDLLRMGVGAEQSRAARAQGSGICGSSARKIPQEPGEIGEVSVLYRICWYMTRLTAGMVWNGFCGGEPCC